ncbi:MAG: hypothetical protein ACK4YQ_02085 [Phenylobacterium sp.]|uniref:hypothetical protein n=1 Tax=Phenylobacterium sp. TaxID=1871053 RepID=UPI003918A3D6
MALPVRPAITPAPAVAPRPDAARLAAQKAFFQAALGKAEPAAAPVQAQRPQAAQPAAARPADPPPAAAEAQDAPKTPLRPGSLLDIRV